jgi:hypothetical protein
MRDIRRLGLYEATELTRSRQRAEAFALNSKEGRIDV